MGLLDFLGPIGSIIGGIAGSGSQAKAAQNQTALQQFQTELAGRIAQANAGNTRANSIRTAPGARLGQATQGNLAQSWTSPQVSWGGAGTMPSVTGGVGGVGTSSTMREIGERNQADALSRSMAGQNATDIAPAFVMPNAPQMSKSSWLDKLLGIGGAVATGVSAMPWGDQPSWTNDPENGQVTGEGISPEVAMDNFGGGSNPQDVYNQFLQYMASQKKQPGQ